MAQYQPPNTGFGDTGTPDWVKTLPAFGIAPAAPAPTGNPLFAGLSSGVHQLVGDVGGLTQAVGTGLGLSDVAGFGKSVADSQTSLSNQRPDLDGSWGSVGGAAYNVAKAVPGIGSAILAGLATPEAAVPAWLARIGEAAPGIIGGGAGLGRAFGKSIIGAGAAFLPGEVAGNVKTEEDANKGAPLSREQAIAAIGLGLPEAALGGLFPASIGKAGSSAALAAKIGDIPAKILKGAMVSAPVNAIQSGLSTGLSQFLGDPDKPIAERAQDVLQSALQGGIIGGIFGGAMGPFHGGEPENTKPPDQVTVSDLQQSTAFLQPQLADQRGISTAQLPSPEKMPLPPGGSGLSDISTDAVMRMYQPLQDKGVDRSAAENLSHVALGQEVAMRTPPGMPVGVNMYSADDMATRAPQIEALKASAFPDAPPNSRALMTFNAASEPELVNWLDSQVKAASPQWLKDKARTMGVEVPGDKNYQPPADILSALNDQLDKSTAARQAAAEAGNGKAARAANATVIDLQSKVANQERLTTLHDQADKLLAPPSVGDALNLQGGAGEAPVRPEATSTEPAGAVPEQTSMLSSAETGAKLAAQRDFQNSVAPGLPEGTLKAHDMPSLVNDLKAHLLANDEANGGDVDKLNPQLKKLMVDTGLIDNRGTNRDLPAERDALFSQYDALWGKAGDKSVAPKDQAAAAKAAQALKAPNGPIDQVEKLQDLHVQADQGEAPEVPGRVRPTLAPTWKALESAKDLLADNPEANTKIKAVADGAQRAIETNSRDAEKRGQFALNQISGLARSMAQRDMSGPVGEPLPADIPPNVKPKNFSKLTKAETKALPAPVAEIPPTTMPKLKQDAIKKGRALSDLTEKPTPVVEPIKPDSLEARIHAAYRDIGGGQPNARVFLSDIRDRMPDVTRADFDKAVTAMHMKNGAFMSGTDNPPEMTHARAAGTLDYKGEKMAVLHINPPEEPARPVRTIKTPATAIEARAELQTLHDKLPEGSSQKDFASKALAQRDPARWKSALRALQLMAANLFRDEGGSLNLDKIGSMAKSLFGKKLTEQQDILNKAAEPMKPSEQVKFADMLENKPTTSPAQAEGRIQDAQGVAALAMHQASDVARTLGSSAPVAIRKAALITESLSGIVRIAGLYLKTSGDYRDNHERMQAIASSKNKADILVARAYLTTKAEGRELVDDMLARLNDGSNLDHRRPLDPASLRDEKTGKLLPNATELQARSKEGQSLMSRIQRAGLRPVLDGILQMNQTKGYQEISAVLSRFGKIWSEKNQGAQLTGHGINPDELYQFRSDLHDSTLGTMKFYADSARAMRDGVKKEIDDRTEKAAEFLKTDPKKAAAMLGDVSDLKSALAHANQRLIETDRGTYAPLGHGKGDYFVAGKIKTDDQGNQLPGSMAAVQKAFEDAGFHNVGFFHDSDSNQIMTRFEKPTQMERARKVLDAMEAAGHLQAGETRNGHPETPNSMRGVAPRFVQSMIDSIGASVDRSGAKGDIAEQIKARMITQLMDNLPDSSIIPNLQKRKYVSGYSKDMGETSINRAINSSRATTMMSMGDRTSAVMEAMRKEVEAAQTDKTLGEKERLIGADAHREIMLREAQQAWQVPKSFIDTIRAATHTVGIGANIGYTVLPMSQIFTLSHGELAKKSGFVKSAKELGSSATEAFQVMKAMAYGKDRTALGFRESDMKAGGVRDWATKVVMDLENRGGLSSYTRTMADLGENIGSKFEQAKGYANMMGSYAETYPRIITALAAAKLHDQALAAGKSWAKEMPRGEYVKQVVDESQFRWGNGETSRLTGGKGPLGSFGKLAFAFTQFQTKMIEKLYGEVHDLISKDSSPQLRKEAGTFLASHLIATVALAGTLGLPASGMLAGVFDKVYTKLTGDQNMDVEGLYRTWLEHTFPGMGDVLAKGLPRAFGVDMSKLGEQHLLPFSQVVQDKRKFEDVTDDWFRSMAGAAVGELGEAYLGLRDMANGDYMLGLQKALPGSLKDFAEAGYLAQHGFVNRQGQKEPIPTTDAAIVMKAMGFKTNAEANYDEASKIASGLKEQRQYNSQNIATHLSRSFMMNDPQGLHTWLSAAMQFQRDNPMVPGPLTSFGRSLQQKEVGQSNAQAFDLPLGMKPYDPIAQRIGFIHQQ